MLFDIEKKKKSGFTLIEVIVVIAIIAILGAILVPNVLGYRQKAEKSNIQNSAKTIVSSIEAYNADKDSSADEIGDGTGADGVAYMNYTAGIADLIKANMLDTTKIPKCLDGTTTAPSGTDEVATLAQLQKVADGDFSVSTVNGTSSSININETPVETPTNTSTSN